MQHFHSYRNCGYKPDVTYRVRGHDLSVHETDVGGERECDGIFDASYTIAPMAGRYELHVVETNVFKKIGPFGCLGMVGPGPVGMKYVEQVDLPAGQKRLYRF